ncbi:hypothetical protein B0T10DRAFT_34564 [Thelonectria olida]|uniref:poly(ADP-ribose) glycohydrolase n=1 Tax=Thelonectria olida TaxID=1576542 RepID=A0A9P8WLK2_9HYPO|nr:hypothetical protein B0T10DRAFT_34564 [Thelonectria olida]
MDARAPHFILASSPSCRVLDRFSDLPDDIPVDEDALGRFPFWPLLGHLLQRPISSTKQFIDVLQTIGATAESTPRNDYLFLQRFLAKAQVETEDAFLNSTWPKLRDIALDLPHYFPEARLCLLEPGQPLRLSRGQVACLVVHQFLCSTIQQRHDGGYQDFGIWYSSEQRHPSAVEMYLTALFAYFLSLPPALALMREHESCPSDDDDRFVTYLLHQGPKKASLEGVALGPVSVDYLKKHSTDSHLPEVQGSKGGVVVSANKVIGFGQSATQEEVFVGIAPEACPVVLVAPHLTNETVVRVSGARAMLNVVGQRRDIAWTVRRLGDDGKWHGGRLIFMDALEMDMAEAEAAESTLLPDLVPGNIDREVHKAQTGFETLRLGLGHPAVSSEGGAVTVRTGLWGCGAFCGDAAVKVLVLWLAASAAGVRLNLMLSEGDQHEIGRRFEELVRACGRHRVSAMAMRQLLSEVPKGLRRMSILEWSVSAISCKLKQGRACEGGGDDLGRL